VHFQQPYKHAKHYLGWAKVLRVRIAEHQQGTGARLMAVIVAAGIGWEVVRTWPGATREHERRLKRQGGLSRHCPICRATGSYHR
jgi:predicted GIY-YIG superfamily endonuclease